MIRRLIIVTLILFYIFMSSCSSKVSEPGRLEGEVTIGPIVPVEKPDTQYEIPCEVYEARKVVIYDENYEKLMQQVNIDCNGFYQVDLEPGFYVIEINHTGIDHSSEVPKKVEIKSNQTTELDIDIDTGIR